MTASAASHGEVCSINEVACVLHPMDSALYLDLCKGVVHPPQRFGLGIVCGHGFHGFTHHKWSILWKVGSYPYPAREGKGAERLTISCRLGCGPPQRVLLEEKRSICSDIYSWIGRELRCVERPMRRSRCRWTFRELCAGWRRK